MNKKEVLNKLEAHPAGLFHPTVAKQMLNCWEGEYFIQVIEGDEKVLWNQGERQGVPAADIAISIVKMEGMIPISESPHEQLRDHAHTLTMKNVALVRQKMEVSGK